MATPTNSTAILAILKSLSLAATGLGSTNLLIGTNFISTSAIFRPQTPSTALAESQIRYLGGAFAGLGPILWWISENLPERLFPLACIGAGIFVGGIGRAVAGWKHGFHQDNVKRAMWVELVAPVVFWVFGRGKGVW